MKKKIISTFLVFFLLFSSETLTVFAQEEPQAEPTFISEELREMMAQASADEKIPVSVWTRETDTEKIENDLRNSIGLNRDLIREWDEEKNGELSSEQVDEYIREERRIYAEEQYAINSCLIEKALKLSNEELIERNAFVGKYSPMITLDLAVEEIESLAGFEDAVSIEYAGGLVMGYNPETPDDDHLTSMNDFFEMQHITELRDQRNLKGQNITIALVNTVAPNRNLAVFTNSDLRGDTTTTGYQGSECACLLVSTQSGAKGIVPSATLYCKTITQIQTVSPSVFYAAIEDCISHNANIICVAQGYDITGSTLTFINWMDHIAIDHSVHIVAAVGDYISDRGTALSARSYNSIAVGNVSQNPIITIETRYQNGANEADKPDICAYGCGILFPIGSFPTSETSSTAFSACTVAGVLAQLLVYKPALKTMQDHAKAVLLAGIGNDDCQYDTMAVGDGGTITNYHEYGAGLIDAHEAYGILSRGTVVSSSFAGNTSANSTITHYFQATSTDTKIRVALTWLKYEKVTSGSHSSNPSLQNNAMASLLLTVRGPNGFERTVDVSASNCQIIQFEVNGSGQYSVEVKYKILVSKRTYYSVAWW